MDFGKRVVWKGFPSFPQFYNRYFFALYDRKPNRWLWVIGPDEGTAYLFRKHTGWITALVDWLWTPLYLNTKAAAKNTITCTNAK